ncbi:NF038122 family metalloprotease [Roseateles toxinivorans]|uniref:Putative secreted protein with PEP-CTERM sorting signal n=1 Tax=Roseateles toxinivorans TaxID=270368 RepID=A0A4R6QP45_9BURK|nr:NF038122 family metalloprotease [Roseateles toxinivorans]TDP72407.1 putative secreted protein with PEP-CTERM sorting signal [Roseateles toxinivorans]
MKKSSALSIVAAAAALVCAAPASALNIVLWDTNNSYAASPDALLAFQKAANYWNKTITNDVTVNIKIGFADLGANVLAQAGSSSSEVLVKDVYGALHANASKSALDTIAVGGLKSLNADGGLFMRVNGYVDAANKIGVDTTIGSRMTSGNDAINHVLDVNTSVQKALGLANPAGPKYDATITFSSSFGFDYNPTNGTNAGTYDFTAVAIHELGHSLGFVSGADTFDYFGRGSGPGADLLESGVFGPKRLDDFAIGSVLDLFRYGASPVTPDGHLQLQWGANKAAFFSIDGVTPFNFGSADQSVASFSTGSFNGDNSQASHWKDTDLFPDAGLPGCYLNGRDVGIMDPTGTPCANGRVTQNDLAAFDAMGWNLSIDALQQTKYNMDTSDIYKMDGLAVVAVPEPATWAQLLLGFGLVGGVLHRRRRAANAA